MCYKRNFIIIKSIENEVKNLIDLSKTDFSFQVKNELRNRIKKTEEISATFKSSFDDYSADTSGDKIKIVFLSICSAILLFFSPIIVRSIGETPSEYSTFGIIAMYLICLYFIMSIVKIVKKLKKIEEINYYITRVEEIRKNLNSKLMSLDKSITNLKNDIMKGNVHFSNTEKIDSEILKYEKISQQYSPNNGDVVSTFVNLLYWLSSILFIVAFIIIAGNPIVSSMAEMFELEKDGLIWLLLSGFALAGFVFFNVQTAKAEKDFGLGPYLLSLSSGALAIPIVGCVLGLVKAAIFLIIIAIGIGAVVIAFMAVFGGSN